MLPYPKKVPTEIANGKLAGVSWVISCRAGPPVRRRRVRYAYMLDRRLGSFALCRAIGSCLEFVSITMASRTKRNQVVL
jgi:hypothetical protein